MNPVLIVAAIVLGAGAAIAGSVLFQMRRMTREMEASSQPTPARAGADGLAQDLRQATQELERTRKMYPGVGDPSQLPPGSARWLVARCRSSAVAARASDLPTSSPPSSCS